MKTPARFTKFKVVAGYLILLAVMFVALYFIRQEIETATVIETREMLKADSLMQLVKQKDENSVRVLRKMAADYDSLLATVPEERLIPLKKNIVVQERLREYEVITRDSTKAPSTRKGFFKRLAEAFVPPKDTTVHTTVRQEVSRDTLIKQFQIEDSIQDEIRTLNEQRQRRNIAILKRNNERLMNVNKQLTARIDTLVRHYDEQLRIHNEQEAQYNNTVRQRSTDFLTKILWVAVALAFVFLIIIWNDINKANRYRRQIEEANRRAEKQLAAREKLMLAITHDFRTPLNSIIGYTNLLLSETKDKDQCSYLENMKNSGAHLLHLVNNLLDFHKLDLEKEQLKMEAFNPARLFGEIAMSFEPLAASKGLKLICHVDAELNGAFISDPQHLRQLATNLLSNAVKFTEKGEIRLTAVYGNKKLTLSIADTGSGMTREECERIFREFIRLSNAQGKEGNGLGLAIVNKLVGLFGTKLEIESQVGKGSTFTVVIPLEPTKQNVEPVQAEVNPVKQLPLHVLMIDDEPTQLELNAAILKNHGAEAIGCTSVEALVEKLRTEIFDILMTDVQMPAMNGFDLLKLLRASNISQAQHIPVIAVSGGSDYSEEEYLGNGFFGFLRKPFSANAMLAALDLGIIADFSKVEEMSQKNKLSMSYFAQYFVHKLEEDGRNLKVALEDRNAEGIVNASHRMLPNLVMVRARHITPLVAILEAMRGKPFSERMELKANKVLEKLAVLTDAARKEFKQYLS